jgi:hypothetical protein
MAFALEAAYTLFLLWLIAAGCSLAHVLIIPEGFFGKGKR